MKIFYYLLLFTNIILLVMIAITEFNSSKTNKAIEHQPEKIKLLPSQVACLEWRNLYGTSLQHARAEISKLNLDHSVIESSMEDVTAYIVRIPAFKTKREMEKQLSQLQKLKITYQLISENVEPAQKDSILLGMYLKQSTALKKLEEMSNLNVKTAIILEQDLEQVKFIFLEPAKELKAYIQQLIEKFPESNLELTQCDRF